MRVAVKNLATIVSGDWRDPYAEGDSIVMDNGLIEMVGGSDSATLDGCDVVIDAGGATALPGLIDSQVHVTFGDFTPRQNTVGYLTSYLHGGTTTSISASEVHVPAGRAIRKASRRSRSPRINASRTIGPGACWFMPDRSSSNRD